MLWINHKIHIQKIERFEHLRQVVAYIVGLEKATGDVHAVLGYKIADAPLVADDLLTLQISLGSHDCFEVDHVVPGGIAWPPDQIEPLNSDSLGPVVVGRQYMGHPT